MTISDGGATSSGGRRIVRRGLLAAGGVLCGIAASFAFYATTDFGNGSGGGFGSAGNPVATFAVDGGLDEVVRPGIAISLNLTIANEYEAPIVVTGLAVTVDAVSAPNASESRPCTTDDFTVSQPSTALEARVPSGHSKSLQELGVASNLWPTVGMTNSDSNQDGCKGASLSLRYTGSGRVE